MRLLPKSEILQKQAAVQKQTIDEGKKLAERIDRLRDVAATEEASLEKFRSETLARIHLETTEAATKRDELKNEVAQLERQRADAIKPLDEEYEALEVAKQALKDAEQDILSKQQQADILLADIEVRRKEIKDALARAETAEYLAAQKLEEASRKEQSMHSSLEEIQKTESEISTIKTKLNTELVHREQSCENRENSIILREQEVEKEKKLLQEERIRLDDRSRTLERAFNRLKK